MPKSKKTKSVLKVNKPTKTNKKGSGVRNEAIAVVQKAGPRMPKTMSVGAGTIVTHTETYGVNVTGSNPFNVFATWALQPGIKSFSRGSPLGQWLPEIAGNFDTYEIESLRFKFRTACSTLTTGLAVFGFEPNPEGSPPVTYQELRNMHSVDGSVHSNLNFDISSKVRRKLLIRKTNVVNLPSYDVGKVYFATIGVNDGALIGFVDVEYRVRLMNPQASVTSSVIVPTNPTLPFPTQRFVYNASAMPAQNCATDCDQPFAYFMAGANAQGATLFSKVQRPFSPVSESLEGGASFTHGNRSNNYAFAAIQAGTYRLRFTPKWDWQDLKMYALCPFVSPAVGNTRLRGSYQIYDTIANATVSTLPCSIYAHRGFTGVVTGDPDPGTDVWPTFEWKISLAEGDDLTILVGVLTYNTVSTTTANVTGRAGLSDSELVVEYLGNLLVN